MQVMIVDPALVLDFLNGSAPPGGGPDPLEAPAFLAHLNPPEARLLRDDALHLRRALGELIEAWTTPGSPPPGMALLELNRLLDARRPRTLMLAMGPAGYHLLDPMPGPPVTGFLAHVAEAAAHLLAHEDPARVRRCAAPGCARWFLDTSRNQRRIWCSMAVCGNRAKVAAHHRRKRTGGG